MCATALAYTARMLNAELLRRSWRSWWEPSNPQGPQWMQWFWTALFSAAIALPLTVVGFVANARKLSDWLSLSNWGYWYGKNLLITLCVGFAIHGLIALGSLLLGQARVAKMKGWRRTLFYGSLSTAGVMIGWPLGFVLALGPIESFTSARGAIAGSLFFAVVIALAFSTYWSAREREAAAEQRATEGQLRLLQAQIEPHFLFNTLATVLSLIEHDAGKARRTLEAFVEYLRASLTEMRRDASTLQAELNLSQAYLMLMHERMDDRLSYSIDIAPELREIALPPLILQPLVENAIHHGLEPKLEGGSLSISATREGDVLHLCVRDDGVGLHLASPRKGNGVALTNVRERLASRYGQVASLELIALHPGTLATLRIPIETAT